MTCNMLRFRRMLKAVETETGMKCMEFCSFLQNLQFRLDEETFALSFILYLKSYIFILNLNFIVREFQQISKLGALDGNLDMEMQDHSGCISDHES